MTSIQDFRLGFLDRIDCTASRPLCECLNLSSYQLNRNDNWIWREFSAELMYPKFEVP
jgi:hypothetical protein